jgi:protein phosphatase
VRPHNEDNFGYDARLGIFVVCDGMGGHAAGEIASQIAVDTILEYFREQGPQVQADDALADAPLGARMLAEAVKKANDAILKCAADNASTSGMGTTLVAARFADGKFSIAHVGDSRIYLFRDRELLQLTEDHSLVMEQVRRGILTMEEAKSSSAQNIITRALGTDEATLPDLGEFPAQTGDLLLMTTDGVLRHVTDEEIRTILQQIPGLQAACDTLIDAANDAGGADNSTCILVRVINEGDAKVEEEPDFTDTDTALPNVASLPVPEPETPAVGVPRPNRLTSTMAFGERRPLD